MKSSNVFKYMFEQEYHMQPGGSITVINDTEPSIMEIAFKLIQIKIILYLFNQLLFFYLAGICTVAV